MNKPDGFVPAVQRYSAKLSPEVRSLQIAHIGVQSKMVDLKECLKPLRELQLLFGETNGPVHFDFAKFIDPQGFLNVFTIAYWQDPVAYTRWKVSQSVSDWWLDAAKTDGNVGYFWETFTTPVERFETIAFKEYVRGLSACPFSTLEPMGESGYWGAARDRIPASGHASLSPPGSGKLRPGRTCASLRQRISIVPPENLVTIRSGVSWEACGQEQLESYEANIKPKLDLGMQYLRNNPVETGCCTLRQSDVISIEGETAKESYTVGYFLSLHDLEIWAKAHPTHLAIFSRAMAERKKYGERLELRTYHEIYVLSDRDARFEYVNCHGKTGLLPFFTSS